MPIVLEHESFTVFAHKTAKAGKERCGDSFAVRFFEVEQILLLVVADGVSSSQCDWKAYEIACDALMARFQSASGNVSQRMVNAAAKPNNVAAKPAPPIVKRTLIPLVDRHKPIKRSTRVNQFAFMKAPGLEHDYEVGGGVEVFCDHEKNRERIRGWVKGIVVQVDNKMVAVQFRSNVYLTDGWMVPDRILWFPLNSEDMRPVPGKKRR